MTEETAPPIEEETAETTAATVEDATRGGAKRYDAATWAEIETHYEAGTMSLAEMEETYGPAPNSIIKHCDRNGIKRNSKKDVWKKRAEEKVFGAMTAAEDPKSMSWEKKRVTRTADIREGAHALGRLIKHNIDKMSKAAHDGTAKAAEFNADLKFWLAAQRTLTLNTDTQLALLGADQLIEEGELPQIIIRDLSDEEIETMANSDTDGEFDGTELPPIPAGIIEDEDDTIIEEGVSSASS